MKKTRKFIVSLLIALCSFVMLLGFSGCNFSNHTHEWIETFTQQEKTCTQIGVYSRKCSCGYEENYIEKSNGHTFETVEAIKPTCTESGCEKGKACTICGEKEVKIIPALGHTGGTNFCTEDSICTRCGETYRTHIGHEMITITAQNATCTEDGWEEYEACIHCKYSTQAIIPAFDHEFVNNICEHCGKEYGSTLLFALNMDGESYRVQGIGDFKGKDLIIPSTYKGLPVTVIGDNAFDKCKQLESVILPNTVHTIGKSAFSGCYSLKQIDIPNSVTRILYHAFSGSDIATISLPESLVELGNAVFFYCEKLESIKIPNGITSINGQLFDGCSNLTSVILSNNIKTIEFEAFDNCINLESITIPASVTEIDDTAFYRCEKLSNITFENMECWQIYSDSEWVNVTDFIWNDFDSLFGYLTNYQWRKVYKINFVFDTETIESVYFVCLDEGEDYPTTYKTLITETSQIIIPCNKEYLKFTILAEIWGNLIQEIVINENSYTYTFII